MTSRNYLTVRLPSIQNNLKNLKAFAPDQKCIAVLKANAYGLGAVAVAHALENDVDFFAVAVPEEARSLVDAGIQTPVINLGFTPREWMDYFIMQGIRPAIYTVDQAIYMNNLAQGRHCIAPIHLAFDTGHGRLGFLYDDPEFSDLVDQIASLKSLRIEGVFSHFACADEEDPEFTQLQIERFQAMCQACEAKGIDLGMKHLANDAGLLLYPESHFDAYRVGICLYGEYPSSFVKNQKKVELEDVFSWIAPVSFVKRIPEGHTVSYGREWTAKRPSKIATVQCGYADGYPRLLSNRAEVLVHGRRAPIVGRICMDQMMVDVTHIPGVQRCDSVILIGKSNASGEQITASDLAKIAQTINYEIMTGIQPRVTRRHSR